MRRLPRFHPRSRRRLSWLVVLLLAWQQLAVAAYACSMPPGASASMPVAVAGADRMAAGHMTMEDSCPSMQEGQAQPPLCRAHCSPEHATQSEARTGTVPPSLLAALPPLLPAVAVAPALFSRAARQSHLQQAPPQSATLLFCSLLI